MSEAFRERPHRTLLSLTLPVLLSLIAEPLTGLADTAFVARLGSEELAALGAGTLLISSVIWIFNFLAIGTQTEVAHAWGAGRQRDGARILATGLLLAVIAGAVFALVGWWAAEGALTFMGVRGGMMEPGLVYLRIRLLGAPAALVMTVAFGAMRGRQDMATPLRIAVASHCLNIALDALLVLGWGPLPRLGVAGAAWASVASQLLAALWSLQVARRELGLVPQIDLAEVLPLIRVGRDLFLRTGLLIAFLALATRAATRIGAEAGAAHQAVRQAWIFGALLLDAFAVAGQSLVGFFLGRGDLPEARRVAGYATFWGVLAGALLGLSMVAATDPVAALLVPEAARPLFVGCWWVAAVAQPMNAVSFVTDGIHWATRDYAFLRNAILVASTVGAAALATVAPTDPDALAGIWWVTALWITLRAGFGVVRIWPAVGAAPLRWREGATQERG